VIELAGRVTRGRFTAELELEVAPGEVVGVVGENGSGKSTLLRVLAGLTPLDEGRLTLAGTVVDDPSADTFVEPEDRPTGVVLQDPTLFPHLDLRDNVAFGARRDGVPKADARAAAEAWLARLGVEAHCRARPRAVSGGQAQRAAIARTLVREPAVVLQDPTLFPHLDLRDNVAFGARRDGVPRADARAAAEAWLARLGVEAQSRARPRAVSGGQAQRAAIARTLVREPAVILLDEPLTALDQDGRTLVRRLLRTEIRRDDRAVVLVSHDPLDALALTDRLVVLEDGRVSQVGTPAEITRRPRSAFVARLVGLNLLGGRAEGTTVTLPNGSELVTATPAVGDVLVTIPPHAVALFRSRPDGSPRNTWPVPVDDLEAVGDRVRVALGGPVPLVAEVTPGAVADLALTPGDAVWATVKATEVDVYPA
jgi:molybdate transport system ATP-binding protein